MQHVLVEGVFGITHTNLAQQDFTYRAGQFRRRRGFPLRVFRQVRHPEGQQRRQHALPHAFRDILVAQAVCHQRGTEKGSVGLFRAGSHQQCLKLLIALFTGGGTLRTVGRQRDKGVQLLLQMVNGHVAHQPVCRLRIAGKSGGEQLLVTFKAKTLIPRRTFADTVLQAFQFALQGMQRHQLFCQRQAGIERTRRLDTGFLNKSAVGEERGRHSGPPYHQHADSGHQCGTQPRKTHRAPARVITRHARPDR